jgi:hypothetical protein
LPHLQELDERLAHRGVIFDHEDDGGGFAYHVEIIGEWDGNS